MNGRHTRMDALAEFVLGLLPGAAVFRGPDVIEIACEDLEGIVVLVTTDTVEIRLPSVEWLGPHTPGRSTCFWKRLRVTGRPGLAIARALMEGRAARLAQFATCHHCGTPTPPEYVIDLDGRQICDSCAEKHYGVIH